MGRLGKAALLSVNFFSVAFTFISCFAVNLEQGSPFMQATGDFHYLKTTP